MVQLMLGKRKQKSATQDRRADRYSTPAIWGNEIPHVPFFLFPVPPILKTNLPKYDLRIRAVLDVGYILSLVLEVLVGVF